MPPTFNKNIIHQNKTLLISLAMIFLCLFLFVIFPTKGFAEDLTKEIFFLVVLPILYIKLILKKNLKDYGFSLNDVPVGITWTVIGIIVSLAIAFILLKLPSFQKNYILPAYITKSFWMFLVYELVFVNILSLINEVFFRGFALFFLAPVFGLLAVAVQSLIFFLVLLVTQNLAWQIVPLIIISLTGGFVAWRTRSFFYSYIMSLIFTIIFDAYIIYSFK